MGMKGVISVGDILYDPKYELIVEVKAFGEDHMGQTAVEYVWKNKTFHTSAFLVFRYFEKLGSVYEFGS